MANAWPPSMKPLAKYLARGRECKEASPITSYYCNFYSAKEGIRRLGGAGDDLAAKMFVEAMLEKCEAEKQSIGADDGSHQQIVENYALSRFKEADDEDIYGPITQATARKYFAALGYLEVCSVFGRNSEEIESKKDFARHRTAAISIALREGREPEPRALQDPLPSDGRGTPLPPAQVDAYQPYPHTMIGFPAEPSAPLPTVQYNAEMVQQYAAENAASLEPSAPPPSGMYDPAAVQQYAAANSEQMSSFGGPPTEQKPMYPSSEKVWAPHSSPPLNPPLSPEAKTTKAMHKLSLEQSSYPSEAPVYESFDENQTFEKSSGGLLPPSRPLPTPPSDSNLSFDRLKKSFSSSTSSYAKTPPSAQSPAQAQVKAPTVQKWSTPPSAYTPAPAPAPAPAPVKPPVVQNFNTPQPAARSSNFTPSIQNLKSAKGYARDAFSALDFPDVNGAIMFLEKALAELRGA